MRKSECRKERHSSQQKEKKMNQVKISNTLRLGVLTLVGTASKCLGWQSFWEKSKLARNGGRTLDLDFPSARDMTLGKPLNSLDLCLLTFQCRL